MKINKSKLVRKLNIDRKTIEKYLKGYVPKKARLYASNIDEYYGVISLFLSEESKQVHFKRVLWQ